MMDFTITLLNLKLAYIGMYYVNNSTRDREEILLKVAISFKSIIEHSSVAQFNIIGDPCFKSIW